TRADRCLDFIADENADYLSAIWPARLLHLRSRASLTLIDDLHHRAGTMRRHPELAVRPAAQRHDGLGPRFSHQTDAARHGEECRSGDDAAAGKGDDVAVVEDVAIGVGGH